MNDIIQKMANHTDMNHWYWLSYGEKCYAFAVVSAFPNNEDKPYPKGGGRLEEHPEEEYLWLSEDGTEMLIDDWIVTREEQNGDTICSFIAQAYTELMKDHLP